MREIHKCLTALNCLILGGGGGGGVYFTRYSREKIGNKFQLSYKKNN